MSSIHHPKRPSFLTSFTRSQVASLTASVVDFGTLVLLVEVFHVYYVTATAIGAAVGAVTNFTMGRYWSFQAARGQIHGQALRYTIVSGISLVLNTTGVFLLTDHFGITYTISKLITAFLVGLLFNFPMHRHFVFR